MTRRFLCSYCDHVGVETDLLTAPSPFDPEDTLTACPVCKVVETFDWLCDEPECKSPASYGTPTPDGYRNTCSRHRP